MSSSDPPYVLLVVGFANGGKSQYDGQYLTTYDPDWGDGLGRVWTSPRIGDAIQFSSIAEALNLWKKQSTVKPLREDGRPNRPMTALTVETIRVKEVPREPA